MQSEPSAKLTTASAGSFRMGLVGRGIRLSRTPAMHEAEAATLGMTCRYELIDTDADPAHDLPEILSRAEAEGFAGLNITYPYKQDVIAHVHHLSDAAKRVGAVNTVVFRDGLRFGHNTDFWGFAESLRRGLPDAPKEAVLLLGAGGAGGAVAHALRDVGVGTLFIYDANTEAAAALADAVEGRAITDLAAATAGSDGIVNATPMGMAKLPGMAIPADLIEPRHWVADIVYFPRETELLATARGRWCRVFHASGMARLQAVRAFELFSGLVPDPTRMRATFEAFTDPN